MFYLHLERYSWLFLQQPGLIINILPLTATGRNNSMARHAIFMCIFAKTNRFRNSSICYSLNSLQCEWCFFTICLWLCNPTFELAYNNKLIDWLIDWLIVGAVVQRVLSRLPSPTRPSTRPIWRRVCSGREWRSAATAGTSFPTWCPSRRYSAKMPAGTKHLPPVTVRVRQLDILSRSRFIYCLQCFDAVGWVAGRASGL